MTQRAPIRQFELANPIYKNASISFYTVASGVRTSTLATLYAGTTGPSQLANPQKLNSRGQFKQPIYIAEKVIGVITGISVPGHDTSIHTPLPEFQVSSVGAISYSYDGGVTWTSAGTFVPSLTGAARETFTATAGQTIFNLSNAYTLGANQIDVYRNGLLQEGGGVDYTETTTTRITFVASLLSAGDKITVETWG